MYTIFLVALAVLFLAVIWRTNREIDAALASCKLNHDRIQALIVRVVGCCLALAVVLQALCE